MTSPAEVELVASGTADKRIATEVRDYLTRMCPAPGTRPNGKPDVCAQIDAIEVGDGTVALHADLKPKEVSAGGYVLCLLITSAGVPDPALRYEVEDGAGKTVKSCPS